jgi:LytS/YehU family sensor histidine kinase
MSQEIETKLQQMEMVRDSLGREKMEWEKKLAFDQQLRRKNQTLLVLLAFIALAVLFAWAIWTRMLYFKRRSLDMQIHSETMEKQQLLNEVNLLKTQVNPHFLFNSLSILSSLVHKNADLSEQFIEQLACSYRYILEQKDQALVSLRTELAFIQSYAFLLKIRFEKKFDLDIDLSPDLLDHAKIAPLTLQLLVENAVKHNRMSVKEPLIVQVRSDGRHLEVRNALRPRGVEAPSTGLGLQNIMHRYALLSDLPVSAGKQGSDFVVRVPLV